MWKDSQNSTGGILRRKEKIERSRAGQRNATRGTERHFGAELNADAGTGLKKKGVKKGTGKTIPYFSRGGKRKYRQRKRGGYNSAEKDDLARRGGALSKARNKKT